MNSKFFLSSIIGLLFTCVVVSPSFGQIPLDGLVGYYMLDGNAADSSGLANDGTVINQVFPTQNRFGEAGKAYIFGGGYIDAGNPVALRLTEAISISAWINPSQSSGWRAIASKWAGFGIGGYYLGINPDNASVRLNLDMVSPLEGNAVTNGEWLHVVATYDGDSVKIYENGVSVNTAAYSSSIYNSNADFQIGSQYSNQNTGFFRGSIDDLLIYNRGLSAEEVEEIYGQQITPTQELFLDHSIEVYPNPTSDILNINNNSEYEISSYSLFNANGQLIRIGKTQEEIDLSNQPQGIYYLLINFDDFMTTKKIIKQ